MESVFEWGEALSIAGKLAATNVDTYINECFVYEKCWLYWVYLTLRCMEIVNISRVFSPEERTLLLL